MTPKTLDSVDSPNLEGSYAQCAGQVPVKRPYVRSRSKISRVENFGVFLSLGAFHPLKLAGVELLNFPILHGLGARPTRAENPSREIGGNHGDARVREPGAGS